MSSIVAVIPFTVNKVATFFDNIQPFVAQYLVPEIGCPFDGNSLVDSCSPIHLNQEVSCIENAVWNLVGLKCSCIAGFYFDQTSKDCVRCPCTNEFGVCDADDPSLCSDSPYWQIKFQRNEESAAKACMANDGSVKLYTLEGNHLSQFDVDMRSREYQLTNSVTLERLNNEQGTNGLTCIGQFAYSHEKSVIRSDSTENKFIESNSISRFTGVKSVDINLSTGFNAVVLYSNYIDDGKWINYMIRKRTT
jgi:hypothetical protein